jgi:hypothetical protein
VFVDDQHPKQKIIKKINKKLSEWHPWYGSKREALISLRNQIQAADKDKQFADLLDNDWGNKQANSDQGMSNKALMHTRRWPFFSKKEEDPEKTNTETFLDDLKNKYGTVTFKKRD